MENLQEIIELDLLAKSEAKKYTKKRFLFDLLSKQKRSKHFTGIVGPRGVGKSVILRQLTMVDENSIYISLDSVRLTSLFHTVKALNQQYKKNSFYIDEIHFINNYAEELKKIYDFLNVKICFSSSVALSLFESSYDLSRRVVLVPLYPFSFREYIFFKIGKKLRPLKIEDLINRKVNSTYLTYEHLFDSYLLGGLYPISLHEVNTLQLLKSVVKKIIRKDIPALKPIKIEEIELIDKVIQFIGKSAIDGINYSTISKNAGITRYKAEEYVQLLHKSFVLNPVFPLGANVTREPKILMSLPYRLLYKSYDDALGGLREDFFTESITMSGLKYDYVKSQRGAKTPDYLVHLPQGKVIIEIGGKNKGREQFKGMNEKKQIILTHPGIIDEMRMPLFLIGFIV